MSSRFRSIRATWTPFLARPCFLKNGRKLALPTLAPMMHDDSPRPKLKQVQLASPHDEPDDPLRVGGVERNQALTRHVRGSAGGRFPATRPRGHQRPRLSPVAVCRNQNDLGFPPARKPLGRRNDAIAARVGLEKSASGWERT